MTPHALRVALALAFAARPPRCVDERELQRALAAELDTLARTGALDGYSAEHRLDDRSRLDFMVWTSADAGIAVEIKIVGSPQTILRQLFRYAEHPAVTGVLLVSTRAKHRGIVPDVIVGKPAACLCLSDYLL